MIDTSPPTDEELAATAGMPFYIAMGFLLARRKAALDQEIRETIEKQMGSQ